jgi:hypothetical protein
MSACTDWQGVPTDHHDRRPPRNESGASKLRSPEPEVHRNVTPIGSGGGNMSSSLGYRSSILGLLIRRLRD